MNDDLHLAAMIGDHSGNPPRDVAPDREPLTLFTEDGEVWTVVDISRRTVNRCRRLAKHRRVSRNELLSEAIVAGATAIVEQQERGFDL